MSLANPFAKLAAMAATAERSASAKTAARVKPNQAAAFVKRVTRERNVIGPALKVFTESAVSKRVPLAHLDTARATI